MTTKTMYMTQKGYAKIQAELFRLCDQELPELASYLHDASAGGYSVDNSELHMLRDQLSFVESRIRGLRRILNNAELIERGEPDGKVRLGNTVIVEMHGEVPETFTIVGSAEADPGEGLISDESPLGKALLDHAVGDDVVVMAPDGEMRFRIIAVT